MNKLILFTFFFFLIACSGEHQDKTHKKSISEKSTPGISRTSHAADDSSYSIDVNPSAATRGSTLTLSAKGFNIQDAEIEWLVNDEPVASQLSPEKFIVAETKRGDMVQAKVTISDSEIFSNTVMIKNTPPELNRVKIMPEIFKPGDRLYVDAEGSDIDGDDVSLEYEWSVNGDSSGNNRGIDIQIKRGDRISVKITPYDGESFGKAITLNKEVLNLPPVSIQNDKFSFDGNTYTYQIKATDPDEDTLTYTLKEGPEGMTIDSATGLLTWEVPPGLDGFKDVQVAVNDDHGGTLTMPVRVKIETAEKKAIKKQDKN
ncbi:MAG: hypothetical protein C4538_01350 [Nitrospiraceae bacterium]|nr:MAG: hypothetical protein C4538_01350 [Nitrospiraceae bacterium]